MKATLAKTMTTFLIAIALFSFAAVFPVAAPFDGTPVLYIEPASNIYDTDTMGLGDQFTFNVMIANTSLLFGLQFKVFWDPALLNGVLPNTVGLTEELYAAHTPGGEEDNIWKIKHLVFADHIEYAYTYLDSGRAIGGGYAPFNITTPELVATITVEIVGLPDPLNTPVSCALDLAETSMSTPAPAPIPHDAVDGYYELNFVFPDFYPYLSVSPPLYEATEIGEVFNVSILVHELSPLWMVVGIEFKLGYNTSMLEPLHVYEGPFMPTYGAFPNQGTLFLTFFGADYVQVGDVILPDVNGTWHAPFPSADASGEVLAIITFNATAQGIYPELLTCPLDIYDEKFGTFDAGYLDFRPGVDGVYQMRPKTLGPSIDIYTQWPDPYGGQGINKPSDMFWLQKQVDLYAYVTYNEWPEQNKDVAFQVIDPHGDTFAVLYARTNSVGVAHTWFRLPWICDDPEYYLGEWTVIGTVDVACVIVNDTLTFKYDYLVHIWKVTIDGDEYAHCSYIDITVDFGSFRMQEMDVILTITALDETRVPFGFVYLNVTIGGPDVVYCQYANYTEYASIHVIKWARAGLASLEVGALNDWPANGGTVMSAPIDPTTFSILALWAGP